MIHPPRAAPLALALLLAACGDGPSTPQLPPLEVVIAAGDGQFGTPGQTLPQKLQVLVRTVSGGDPREGVGVMWVVESGDASFTTSAATLTDESGSAFATVRFGSTAGEVRVGATVTDQSSATATFVLNLVDRPELQSLSSSSAAAGESIVLTGMHFSPTAAHNVVLFSGIRGAVTAATGTQLTVEVPRCLPARQVDVTVQLGAVASAAQRFTVTEGGQPVFMQPGQAMDITDDLGCVRVGGGLARYLAIVQSASTVAGAQHAFELTGLSGGSGAREARARSGAVRGVEAAPSIHERFEAALREREAGLVRGRAATRSPVAPRAVAAAAVPAKGDRRTFNVLNKDGGFDRVEAVAKFVGAQAALFVEDTGTPGFTEGDLAAFARRFDEVIHPTVTGAFGSASDLDSNQRIVILFTSTVNRLTPKGAQGFVGGFFFGLDLLPERNNSNGAEIFYTLVPDPNGAFSDPRPKSKLLEVVPAILAHEFEHMVHFNERILGLDAESNEALWLSEGLAQMAEELVARAYEDEGRTSDADLFRSGNRSRSKRYLEDPEGVSLIVSSGQGSLPERGAGWLHVLYLTTRAGESVLGQLVRSTRSGVGNVTNRLGLGWEPLLADWWSATYLDGMGFEPQHDYAGLDLRALLGDDNYALDPHTVGSSDFTGTGSLWSSSPRYYIVVPSLQGSVTLRLGGEAGGASPPGAALRLRLVRLQ